VTSYEPVQLADLAGRADLVVEASTTGGQSVLKQDETDIYTDYTFTISALIKNRRRIGLHVGDAITVRRVGGSVQIDGRTVQSIENGFPVFNAGERYILFLVQTPRPDAYAVMGGPQGVFGGAETISQLSADDDRPDARDVPRAAFLNEVRALLKFAQ
jgi:hypothetical protein